ncbi:hypothetical protein BDB01DRAFT_803122 [Pilobolus umbonatus]|nr:hypothetical protein BDB01DRAFT_803122 [Pilobolus umbonatus]
MKFSINLHKLFKKSSSHKETSTNEEEVPSGASTPANSIFSHSTGHCVVTNGFLRDPMRCGNHPDVVGHYYDPMGGHYGHSSHGVDPTNTGA